MSDRAPETHDTPKESQPDDAFNPSRRRLTGAALGVSAVFTLASRPVWANQCTISGMASGNLSAPPGPACAGCAATFWAQPTRRDSWPAGVLPTDKFNTIFGVAQYVKTDGTPYTLLEVLQTLNAGNDPISNGLGVEAVAALLNAAHANINYGYTSGELITLFRSNLHRPAALKDSLALLNGRSCPLA
jgi:hypothetical protein